MGREGEVVAQLLPEFERTHPGIRVEVQQLPWTAAHEKLLTAFAGDATPDICQLGNTWIPEFAALDALEPLDADVAASPVDRRRAIISRASGTPTASTARSTACRGTSTPACCSIAATCSRRPASTRRRATWAEWIAMLAAIKRAARRGALRHRCCRSTNSSRCVALALQQDDPLLRDGGRYGNFAERRLRRALQFYVDMFRKGYAPPSTDADVSNVWNEFGRGHFVFYISGPWNIGEFQRRLPPELAGTAG